MVLQGNAVANGWELPEVNSNERIYLLILLQQTLLANLLILMSRKQECESS